MSGNCHGMDLVWFVDLGLGILVGGMVGGTDLNWNEFDLIWFGKG
jgi:hypothetical protein